ncbi:MAG: amino acid permease [Streptococcaceae bacterium]|jgi:APA family basic amino acid/polyamine antiporter|nr:amino acid permease [Streptococcaceae bacterium]
MENQELKKTIGFFPALSLVVGGVIGSGVFFKAATIAKTSQSQSMFMLVWVLGGILSVCAALTGAEIAAAIPETGGMLRYIERGYGKGAAFLLGWAQIVIYFPADVAALSIAFATQCINLFGLPVAYVVPIAMITAIVTAALNFLGSKVGTVIQSGAFILKLIPLLGIIIAGLFHSGGATVSLFPVTVGHDLSFWPALGAGLIATIYAYNGWIYIGNVAGEMKNPAKHLPRAIVGGILLIMAIYVVINFVYLRFMPISQIAGNQAAVNQIAEKLLGSMGGKFVTIGIMISVYGVINSYTFTGMRQPYALAQEALFPFSKTFAKLSKTGVPVNAGLLELALALLMLALTSFSKDAFDMLTNMLIFVIWLFYTLVFIAVYILRKKEPELKRPYKVPLYPFVPAIAILGGLFIIGMELINDPKLSLIGLGVTLIGLPLYFIIKPKKEAA